MPRNSTSIPEGRATIHRATIHRASIHRAPIRLATLGHTSAISQVKDANAAPHPGAHRTYRGELPEMPSGQNIIAEDVICADGMPAYLAKAQNGGGGACIVLMHERYGLVDHTKDLARRFAGEGYTCIAPDLFFRHPDQDALHAGDSRCDITDGDAARDLSAAIDALEGVDGVDVSRCAVMGVCQTGRHTL